MGRRAVLILMVLVVVVPWGIAWWMVNHADDLSLQPVVAGTLIDPPVAVGDLGLLDGGGRADLSEQWWVLYVTRGCDASCIGHLHDLRQLHVALGKGSVRVDRGLVRLSGGVWDARLRHFSDLRSFVFSGGGLPGSLLAVGVKKYDFSEGVIYLVDPVGNVMMVYSSDVAVKLILKDVQRLLRGSHLG